MTSKASSAISRAAHCERLGDWAGAADCYRVALNADAELVTPHLRLSRFAQWEDAYQQSRARAHDAAAVIRRGKRLRDAGYVSQRLLEFSDYKDAVEMIQNLDWCSPDVLRQSAVLIQHLWLAGGYETALECLEKIIDHTSNDYRIEYLTGLLARTFGQLDKATHHFEQTLRMQPDFAEGYWMLTQHGKSRAPSKDAELLQNLLNSPKLNEQDRVYLEYARYRRLEEAGDWQGAWQALQNRSAYMRKRLPYDSAMEASRIENLIKHDWSVLPESPGEDGSPLFIVGMPRTGTTVLERMLSGHSRVASAGERNDFDAALSEASDHFHRGGLHEENVARYDDLDQGFLSRRYRERIGKYPPQTRMVIDKNPMNLFNVGWILRAMPDARIICVRRNPMDSLFSNYRALFEGGAYAYSYDLHSTAQHVRNAHALMAYWQQLAPNAVRIVDYEEFVADPASVARALCGFCGVRYEPSMVDISTNSQPVNTASSSQVREAIHAKSVGAWQPYTQYLEPLRVLLPDST